MSTSELTGYTSWIRFESKNVYSNKNFQRILDFYLFNCPVENTSVRSKTFNEYGWETKHFSVLSKKLRNASDSKIRFHRVPVNSIYDALLSTNQLTKINFDEETVIYHDSSNSMDTLFSAIRNAFAHGSYQLKTYNKTRYYCFENRQTGNKNYFDKEIRARIVLKESTLLNWIQIIESGNETAFK